LAVAQYQHLQLLQLIISQQAFALGMLMHHAGEGRSSATVLANSTMVLAKSCAVRGFTTAIAKCADCSAQAASNS